MKRSLASVRTGESQASGASPHRKGAGLLGRFWVDVRGEGTSTSAVRIAVWTVIALAMAGLVGPSVYRVAAHTAGCADAAVSGGSAC